MEEKTQSPPLTCPNTVTVRRNPHRKARPTTISTTKNTASLLPAKGIPSFPIQDILSIKIPQTSSYSTSSSVAIQSPPSESLKVYVRIRGQKNDSKNLNDQNSKTSRSKSVWPQNPAKKQISSKEKNFKKNKSGEGCITVNDPHSVTLSPPLSLQESKRVKSEIYKGFTHVFSSNSSQAEVYETMVNPLVEDFLRGKSGMLAALGPTGSGKTHTVFGSGRDPGMVPLALQRIFKQTKQRGDESLRSFYMSVFEICSERGKGESIYDLSQDGGDLCLQQSTIKGLQVVAIRDAAQAESLIARAMLKRATAMTNSNSQSSRSQCIINIRSVSNRHDGEVDIEANSAVLTIVDLAGAEREKRTGNQGARLLESNFINNTSMVFGLCLRSLLEHQKNPKKPLPKHFHNSMLTRYLRDYLEGKKRMSLVLTVKSGEKDYLDTSYLLRQASPFMQIKFDNIEEPAKNLSNKRHFQILSRIEQPKRMKLSSLNHSMIEQGKDSSEEHQLRTGEASRICKLDINDSTLAKLDSDLAKRERSNQIMQNFAKALWNVLKEYNEKLKVAESEIESLRQNLNNENTRYSKLEKELKELKDLKSFCACSQERAVLACSVKVDTNSESKVAVEDQESINFDMTNGDNQSTKFQPSECSFTPRKCNSSGQDQDVLPQIDMGTHSPVLKAFESIRTSDKIGFCLKETSIKLDPNSACRVDLKEQEYNNFDETNVDTHSTDCQPSECKVTPQKYDSPSGQNRDVLPQTNVDTYSTNCQPSECSTQKYESLPGQDRDALPQINLDTHSPNPITSPSISTPDNFGFPPEKTLFKVDTNSEFRVDIEEQESTNFDEVRCYDEDALSSTYLGISDFLVSSSPPAIVSSGSCHSRRLAQELNEGTSDLKVSPKEVTSTRSHNNAVAASEPKPETFDKPLNTVKPKRKLLPASATLLRDISALDIKDESEKPRGNRGGKKLSAADERKMTQGSISLIRLLKSNRHDK